MIPNSPHRRAELLQAHALRARGYTIAQIAEQTSRSPATVHAGLKDFEAKREQFVAQFAQDQLLVLLHTHSEMMRVNELHPPQNAGEATIRDQQMQAHTALARELRMVCTTLARHVALLRGDPEDELLTPEEVDAITHAPILEQQLTELLRVPTESSRIESEIFECPEERSPANHGQSANSPLEKSSPEIQPLPVRKVPRPSFLAAQSQPQPRDRSARTPPKRRARR